MLVCVYVFCIKDKAVRYNKKNATFLIYEHVVTHSVSIYLLPG